jgi:hypothetical protein
MLEIVISIVAALLTGFILPWLRAKYLDAKLLLKARGIDINNALLNNIENTVMGYVANAMEREYPEIAKMLKEEPEVSKEDVKIKLYELGDEVLSKVAQSFKHQGIDIFEIVEPNTVREIIRRVVDLNSPFQKKETSAAFMEPGVASKILEVGLDFEYENLESTDEEGKMGFNPDSPTDGYD